MARRADRRTHRLPVPTSCLLPSREGISVFGEDPWAPPTRLERLAGHLGPRVVGPVALARLRLRVRRKPLPDRLRAGRRKLLRLALRRPAPAEVPASETTPLPTGPFHPGSAAAAPQSSPVLALGGGYLTDADRTWTVRVLNLVGPACNAGVPVTLVGLEQTLAMAIDREWRTALVVREPQCARAQMKVDASRAPFDRVATLTQARATAPIALPRDHLPPAADPT